MVISRISVSAVSVLVVICITRVNCISYLSPDSLTLASPEEEEIEHAENPRIEVRYEDRIINDTLTKNGRYGDIDVVVHAFKKRFVLNLTLNRRFIASTYIEKIIGASETRYNSINHTENNCYYIGSVQDNHNSAAAVSTCKGIRGHFSSAGFSYQIETGEFHLNGPHKVHRIRSKSNMTDDNGTEGDELFEGLQFTTKLKRRKRSFNWPQDKDGKTKVLELYIVNDHKTFVDLGSNADAVIQHAKDIASFAGSGFLTFGIYFVLVGMEVWTDKDEFSIVPSNDDTILNPFNSYRMQSITPVHYNDFAILLTSVSFSNRNGGSKYGKMCSNKESAAWIGNAVRTTFAAKNMAHVIGYNFGVQYDNAFYTQSCHCSIGSGLCIMNNPVGHSPELVWSECSVQQLNYHLSHGTGICLYDVPQTIFQPTLSTCGNGIIETNEQCDCEEATYPDCNPSFCNLATCQLIGSASCASGRCCDTVNGQILPAGSVCRNSTSGCDLPERCDGRVATCPVDTYRPDGTPCTTINGDSVYCYGGKCRSHNSQCQLLWGKGTNSSNSNCYKNYNIAGKSYGNCGYNWLPNFTYIACQNEDVMCGTLFCRTTVNQELVYYQSAYTRTFPSFIDSYNCSALIFDFGLRVEDPSFAPNGASCGDGKVCVNHTCIDVNSLQTPCYEDCQGDEVCNNLGRCQSQTNEMLTTTPVPKAASPSGSPTVPILAAFLGLALALSLALGCYICFSSSPAPSLQNPAFVSRFPANANEMPGQWAVLRNYPNNRGPFFN